MKHYQLVEDEKRGAIYAACMSAWRAWLEAHHAAGQSTWLIIYHKDSGIPSVWYPDAVDEALCFGWVDSKPNKRDDHSYYQFFAPRKARSNWSKVNKEKVARLIAESRMAPAGLEMVKTARANGTWDALNEVEAGIIPNDLMEALQSYPDALTYFEAFPRSVRRAILEWILNARKAETRTKRITETARLANDNIRANQWHK